MDAGVAGKEKFVTIRSGMDITAFETAAGQADTTRQRLGIRDNEIVIGKVARLFPLKGHEYFIDAAEAISRKNKHVRYLLVGDGILRSSLEERVRQAGLEDAFIFAGLVQPDEIPEMIAAMDIVVHASLREGLAKVLVQALAERKPVVSFDIDGAREVVRNGC